MKPILTFLITLITLTTFAQQGINYKAIIKDDLGNVIANESIGVEFSIQKGTPLAEVYLEEHTITTDANGLIILNIGEGLAVNGTFAQIDWDSDEHYLNTQIAYNSMITDLGTTPFKTVPYALDAANVKGLELLKETGGNEGWRLVGRDPDNYGYIGGGATDLSTSNGPSATLGATGIYSFATGFVTTASGDGAVAMGLYSSATGNNSTAIGNYAFAEVDNTWAIGSGVFAKSYGETTMGSFNSDYVPSSATSWDSSDRLFGIGNGTGFSNKSDALIILKNGTITAPSLDLSEITNPKALTTKEYVDANADGSGLETLNEGNGNGWRLKGRVAANYGNIGFSATDLSFSGGLSTNKGATGSYAFATGNGTTAFGNYSVATGFNTLAYGDFSVAFGRGTAADGDNASAFGTESIAIGANSSSFGHGTAAYASNETVVGSYNEPYTAGNANTDRLFVVGNGTSSANRSNVLAVLNSGKVGIGTNLPNAILGIQRNSSSAVPQLELIEDQPDDGARLDFVNAYETNHKWTLYGRSDNSNNFSEFNIFYSGNIGNIMSLRGDGNVYVNGSLVHSSDRRLKKDISDLPYGLNEILQLQPKQYFWKNRTEQTRASLGLIAQDVQKIIANVVKEGTDDKKTLSLSYTELIPVLINAIKEQQAIISTQSLKIEGLTSEVETLKTQDARIKQLETILLKNSQQ